jgi:alanyl-tRNA synthetase
MTWSFSFISFFIIEELFMTTPLFDTNPYLKEITATVTGCTPTENGFYVTLNQTIFFPEGGGQWGDTGTIDHINVTDTLWDGDEILHLCTDALPIGKEVSLCLDWKKRFDAMQQHTGEHILSYAFWYLFGFENTGFHLNETFGTLDLDHVVTWDQIAQAVTLSNQIVTDNRQVRTYIAKAKSLDRKRVRKISQKGGDTPRVVDIDGADICTCCGTHVARTGEVGGIAIIKSEKSRGGSRLTFLCGNRTVADHDKRIQILHGLTSLLSTDAEQLAPRIKEMQQELQSLRLAIKEKNKLLFSLQADKLLRERGNSPYVLATLDETPAGDAKILLNLLTSEEPVTAIVIYTKGESLSFFCGANPHSQGQSCRTVCDLLCGIYNGKGGGKDNFAQGGGKAVADYKDLAKMIVTQLERMS